MTLVVEAVSVAEVEANAATITGTEPAGTVEGDLLVAVVGADGTADPNVLASNTGWTELVNGATSGRNVDLMVEFLVRGPSAPDLVWNHNSSQESVLIVYRISGYLAADPIGATAISDGSTTTPTSPGITTEDDNSLVIRCYANDDGGQITEDTGYPPGTTGRFRKDTGGTDGISCGAADEVQATAGATGTAVWGALAASKEWFAASIEIKADPAAGVPTAEAAALL